MSVEFNASQGWTVGVEWELGTVDPVHADLVPAAEAVLTRVRSREPALEGRVTGEFLTNTVELVTGVCADAGAAVRDLSRTFDAVRRAAHGLGADVFCAGTHPFADWQDQQVSPGARYATLMDRTRWWGRQLMIFGLHVHVGIPDRRFVLPLLDAMLTYQPVPQVLSASSPFSHGHDTGYASNRALLFQQLPTGGLPVQFGTWREFETYVDDMVRAGVVQDVSELRWDVRPSPRIGTLEVRVCDGVPSLAEVGALTALVHCLVVGTAADLTHWRPVPALAPWFIRENKWRAARYGLDAVVVVDDGSRAAAGGPVRHVPVRDQIEALVTRLAPVAHHLGCWPELASVLDLVAAGPSYRRQRGVAARSGGDLGQVVRHLVAETGQGRMPAPPTVGAVRGAPALRGNDLA